MTTLVTITCAACGGQTPAGKKFCVQCGTPVSESCPSCGAHAAPGARFCFECGTPLAGEPAASSAPGVTAAERRVVSVLFVDLVGFDALSGDRDPEEVRELLSRYFAGCRTTIERYGGVVEKFIGDAVCSVWGAPVAREDDAERAVRAALALLQGVRTLGVEVGAPELRARAGVLTGLAAVRIGAEGDSMVHGDAVNTASRLQSIAASDSVLVDDVTHRASEAAIVYEEAGNHQVKGRAQPVHAWTALRVVAGAGGALRRVGLEAPFVGRDRELGLIVDAAEISATQRRAQLVTIVGEAGLGKSRLLWEFFKYVDGIDERSWWHQGRCLSYGTGLTFWALAEMVRGRLEIVEGEDRATARQKLQAALAEHVPDDRERRLIEPRLAHLLSVEQRTSPDRADLFSGWRLFFERLADTGPVILAFEDLEWADSGLLDFIDYMLEWCADFPILILALGRPEMLHARPGWTPNIVLDPLGEASMMELLGGLVPGLPDELATQIRRRAEGVPVYAVETVRMLLDRGLVAQRGARYVVTGDVSDLEVPESLHTLAMARLDNLDVAERTLLQDAAVIGQTFTLAVLVAVAGRAEAEVRKVLDALVVKQLLRYIDDARSADRGQYAFRQPLVRQVALGTLSRRDRKARHLSVARHLEETQGEEVGEHADLLASHYLDAVAADPNGADASAIRTSACETLAAAGHRALSLALGLEARRHLERAAELATDPLARSRLLCEAGLAADLGGELEDALSLLTSAITGLREAGIVSEAATAEGHVAKVLIELGRLDEASDRLETAFQAIDDGREDESAADLAERRAEVALMRANLPDALRLVEPALRIADSQRLGRILARSLITKSNVLAEVGRPGEAVALMRYAVDVAVGEELPAEAARGYGKLADFEMAQARFTEGLDLLERGLAFVRRRGDRPGERRLLAEVVVAQIALGQWDAAVQLIGDLREQPADIRTVQVTTLLPLILSARGDVAGLQQLLDESWGEFASWREARLGYEFARAVTLRELGRHAEALDHARAAVAGLIESSVAHLPLVFAEAVECAFAAGRTEVVQEMLEHVERLTTAQRIPLLGAEAARARARAAADRGELDTAEQWFKRAGHLLRELSTPFHLARVQLEHAEVLAAGQAGTGEMVRLCQEAEAVFRELRAAPWLERTRALDLVSAA
jgi:class 3 adenylate cyclase/tetratricopeptide (TPR) repeat protein